MMHHPAGVRGRSSHRSPPRDHGGRSSDQSRKLKPVAPRVAPVPKPEITNRTALDTSQLALHPEPVALKPAIAVTNDVAGE